MKESQKRIIEDYVSAYNNFHIDGMIRNLDDKIIFTYISQGEVDLRTEGLTEFIKQAEASKEYFTQRKQTIKSWEFTDSTVIIEIDYEAILAVDLPNGLKAGDTLALKGQSEFVFVNDKIRYITDRS